MTAATGKPPEGEKKGKDKEKKDSPPCKVLLFAVQGNFFTGTPPKSSECQPVSKQFQKKLEY